MSSTLRFGKREEQSQSPSRALVPLSSFLGLTVLVKGSSSGPSHCGGLGFSSQSVVNVSADRSVSFRVWKGIVGASPNGIRAPSSDASRSVAGPQRG